MAALGRRADFAVSALRAQHVEGYTNHPLMPAEIAIAPAPLEQKVHSCCSNDCSNPPLISLCIASYIKDAWGMARAPSGAGLPSVLDERRAVALATDTIITAAGLVVCFVIHPCFVFFSLFLSCFFLPGFKGNSHLSSSSSSRSAILHGRFGGYAKCQNYGSGRHMWR